MKKTLYNLAKMSFVFLALIFLIGCNPSGEKKSNVSYSKESKKDVSGKGEVLLSINGKPVLTEGKFNKHLTQMLQVNPYFKGMSVDALPTPLKKKFFDELIKQEIIVFSQEKNKVDKNKKFIESYKQMKELVKRSLLIQNFEKSIVENIKISDREIRNHFNENKDKFVKEPGGILISAVKFEDKDAALQFYNKVNNQPNKFVDLAKQNKAGEFKDYGRVSETQKGFDLNSVPSLVRKKAFELNSFPSIEKMDIGKKVWVILFSDKKEAKYFDFNEIKDQLEAMLKNNKFREELDKAVDKIKGQFSLDINEEYFKELEPENEEKGEEKTPKTAA